MHRLMFLAALILSACTSPATPNGDGGTTDESEVPGTSFGPPGNGTTNTDGDTGAEPDTDTDTDSDADTDTDTDSDSDSDSDTDTDTDSDSDSDADSDADTDVNDGTTDDDGDGFCEDDVACSDGSDPGDCDDTDSGTYPDAAPLDSPGDCADDDDNDDYADDDSPEGVVEGTDCDDQEHNVNPGESEIPDNGKDDDCHGGDEITDEDVDPDMVDNDGDGYCEHSTSCVDGSDPGDCDDGWYGTYPGAPLWCDDGGDHDCNGTADSLEPACIGSTCVDDDGDGFTTCEGDCDDGWNGTFPGAPLWCDDGGDHDCDGTADSYESGCDEPEVCEDLDGDSFTTCEGDCDDGWWGTFPGAALYCLDGGDHDCNGMADAYETGCLGGVGTDADGDGHIDENDGGDDCDDSNADIHPGAQDRHNVQDDDCDGEADNKGLKRLNRCYADLTDVWADVDGNGVNECYDTLDHWYDADADCDGGIDWDGHWMEVYPTNICSGPYRPTNGCTETGGKVLLWGGYELSALSQCSETTADGLRMTLLLAEDGGEYDDYNCSDGTCVRALSCTRLGYVLSGDPLAATVDDLRNDRGSDDPKMIYRHSSAPFDGVSVPIGYIAGDVMFSSWPDEGETQSYDAHDEAFYVPRAGWY